MHNSHVHRGASGVVKKKKEGIECKKMGNGKEEGRNGAWLGSGRRGAAAAPSLFVPNSLGPGGRGG